GAARFRVAAAADAEADFGGVVAIGFGAFAGFEGGKAHFDAGGEPLPARTRHRVHDPDLAFDWVGDIEREKAFGFALDGFAADDDRFPDFVLGGDRGIGGEEFGFCHGRFLSWHGRKAARAPVSAIRGPTLFRARDG